MKLLHIVSTYPPYKGGMGNVVFEEVRELVRRGHEVHVATLRSDDVQDVHREEDGVTVHRLGAEIRWGKAGLSRAIERMMHDSSFDAVHLHVPFFGVQELAVLKMWFGWRPANLVITYHMDIVAGGFVRLVSTGYRWFFLGTLVRRARTIVTAAKGYVQTSWLQRWQRAVNEKLVEAPFGVDIERYKPQFPIPHSQFPMQLMFLGGLDRNHYFKGLEVLIRALQRLQHRDDWKLIVVGDGDLRSGYERQVEAAGLSGRVSFLGREIGRAEQHYRESDVFVFPSVDRSEAFGLVALEAQASGVPVIASGLPGVSSAVADGETGVLFPPGDDERLAEAIVWMMDHPDERAWMGREARVRVEAGYTWRKHVDTLEEVYGTL